MNPILSSTLLIATLTLAACGERPQTVTDRKVDDKPWASPATDYTTTGWKSGDRAAWEQQIRRRGELQNEYLRTGVQPK